jgi:hypothetical protein
MHYIILPLYFIVYTLTIEKKNLKINWLTCFFLNKPFVYQFSLYGNKIMEKIAYKHLFKRIFSTCVIVYIISTIHKPIH